MVMDQRLQLGCFEDCSASTVWLNPLPSALHPAARLGRVPEQLPLPTLFTTIYANRKTSKVYGRCSSACMCTGQGVAAQQHPATATTAPSALERRIEGVTSLACPELPAVFQHAGHTGACTRLLALIKVVPARRHSTDCCAALYSWLAHPTHDLQVNDLLHNTAAATRRRTAVGRNTMAATARSARIAFLAAALPNTAPHHRADK